MDTTAIVFEQPGTLSVKRLALNPPGEHDIVVDTLLSGISTGTEKMLFDGSMPAFPGMGYPLVPGYESVATVIAAGSQSGFKSGQTVFVPGAACFSEAQALFGATADRLVLSGARAVPISEDLAEDAVLIALAATAHRAVKRSNQPVDMVIGHGVLGRLIARIALAYGQPAPTVLEADAQRRHGGEGYTVLDPSDTAGPKACGCVIDASGDPAALDSAITRLGTNGLLVLAGFYGERASFAFPPAFMKEVSISLAAEFKTEDIRAVLDLVATSRLSLKGLVTHRAAPAGAAQAYRTAFSDPACLKMVIDWRKAA